jgi:hypothetical protein
VKRSPVQRHSDVSAVKDTILVPYYNAPNAERLRLSYEGLPQKLEQEGPLPTCHGSTTTSSTSDSVKGNPDPKSRSLYLRWIALP